MRFRWRLALYGAAVVALMMLLFGGILAGLANQSAPEDQRKLLAAQAEDLAEALTGADPSVVDYPPIALVDLAESTEAATLVVDPEGSVIGGTALVQGAPPQIGAALIAEALETGHVSARTRLGPVEVQLEGARTTLADGDQAVVLVMQPSAALDEQIAGFRAVVWVAAIISFAVALVASWLVSGRALRPLRRMAATADEIRETRDLSRRLPTVKARRDELARITNSFNDMVGQLEASQAELAAALDAQRRFVADASHELRSPLTTIRNNAEFLMARDDIDEADRRDAVEDISAEAKRMSDLVDDLLALARGESLDRRVPVSVADLIEAEADRLRRAGHRVDVHVEHGTVMGDPAGLERLLRILTTNALHHGREPLTLRCGRRRGSVYFGVADHGEGFPPDELVVVFDRFYRADPARARTGTGLGLAIAQQIAITHGGQIIAANRPGGGAVVEVELPPYEPSGAAGPVTE